MQTTSRDSRLSGLIAILGLVTLLVGLIVMLLLPDIRLAAWGILFLGIILLAAAFIMDYRRVGRALTSRRGRFGVATTVMVSIIIGIIILVNAISVGNYQRFDVTGVAQFILTSQTKEALNNLKTPIRVLCFFVPVDPYGLDINIYAEDLLTRYQEHTDQLEIEIIDPDLQPDQARQYGITEGLYQSVVFESQDRRRVVTPLEIAEKAENAFTSAILEVTGVVQKKVYFLAGHGEGSVATNYRYARDGLLDNLYKVDTLDLLIEKSIPEDCAALIIAGPQKALDSSEIAIIKDYLENGGWVMFLTNPNSPQGIAELLSPWGVDIGQGTIIDPGSYLHPNQDNPSVPRTRNFFGFSTTYFPGATAIIPQAGYTPKIIVTEEGSITSQIVWSNEESQIEMYSLVRTSQESWLDKNFDPKEEPEFNEEIEEKGPLNIGFLILPVLVEDPEVALPVFWNTRIVIFGDSDFASNEHFYEGSNGGLFLNCVELLTEGKELISIERKVLPFRRLIVDQVKYNFIRISSMALLPILVLIAGGIIWWRRR